MHFPKEKHENCRIEMGYWSHFTNDILEIVLLRQHFK